jgi:hypothetical protein
MSSGMSLLTAAVFFGLVFIIWMGIARMSIEGGLISTRTVQAQFPVVRILGAGNMTSTGLVAIAMTKNWHHDMKTALIAPMANAVKVTDASREHRNMLVLAMAIAVVVVAGGSAYYAIASGYQTGAYNYGSIYADSVQSKFDTAVGYIKRPVWCKAIPRVVVASRVRDGGPHGGTSVGFPLVAATPDWISHCDHIPGKTGGHVHPDRLDRKVWDSANRRNRLVSQSDTVLFGHDAGLLRRGRDLVRGGLHLVSCPRTLIGALLGR